MALRAKLVKLKDLVDPGTILAVYGVTREDLDLLAKVEELMGAAEVRAAQNEGQ